MGDTSRLYVCRHRGSRFRDRVVRVMIRPRRMPAAVLDGSVRRGPRNVLCETLEGDRFACPWRGLRRMDGRMHGV